MTPRRLKFALVITNIFWAIIVLFLWQLRSGRQSTPAEKKTSEAAYLSGPVKNTIVKNSPALQECYQVFLSRRPEKSQAGIKIDWEILSSGKSRRVQKVSNEFGDSEIARSLESCVIGKISEWQFPEPPHAEPVYVAHRFFFGEHQRGAPKMVNTR